MHRSRAETLRLFITQKVIDWLTDIFQQLICPVLIVLYRIIYYILLFCWWILPISYCYKEINTINITVFLHLLFFIHILRFQVYFDFSFMSNILNISQFQVQGFSEIMSYCSLWSQFFSWWMDLIMFCLETDKRSILFWIESLKCCCCCSCGMDIAITIYNTGFDLLIIWISVSLDDLFLVWKN